MEQRLEAVLAAQSLGGIRGILPGAGGMQRDGTFGPVGLSEILCDRSYG
jgi:hypothetical protein